MASARLARRARDRAPREVARPGEDPARAAARAAPARRAPPRDARGRDRRGDAAAGLADQVAPAGAELRTAVCRQVLRTSGATPPSKILSVRNARRASGSRKSAREPDLSRRRSAAAQEG